MTNTVNGAAVQQPTIKKKSRAGEIWRRFRRCQSRPCSAFVKSDWKHKMAASIQPSMLS